MKWNKILLAYSCSPNGLRVVDYVGKMYRQVKGVKVTIFYVYDKLPDYAALGDTPVTDKLKSAISSLKRLQEEYRHHLDESRKRLLKMGFTEDQVEVKFVERNKNVARQIIEEVQKGGYGTVVMGRRGRGNFTSMIFGSVSNAVIQNLSGVPITIVD